MATISEILEPKAKKSDLSKYNHLLKSIVGNSPDVIYLLDKNGKIEFISEAISTYGYKSTELIGKNIFDLVHPDDRKKALYKINERRTGKRSTKTLEIRLITKGNKTIPFETNITGFKTDAVFSINAEGVYNDDKTVTENFSGTQGMARDITVRKKLESILKIAYENLEDEVQNRTKDLTETNKSLIAENSKRRKAEKKLAQSNDSYKLLFNSINEAMFVCDLETNTILEVNKAVCDHLSFSKDELVGHSLFELIDPESLLDVPFFDQHKLEKFVDEKHTTFQTTYISKHGDKIPFEVNAYVFEQKGKMRVLAVSQSMNDKLTTEQHLRRYSNKLEKEVSTRTERIKYLENQRNEIKKITALGRMAAQVAHEINNPLAGIKNSFLLIKEAINPNHRYSKYSEKIEKEIERIANIVRQMFDLYRPGETPVKEYNINSPINDVITLLGPKCLDANIKVNYKPKSKFKVRVPEGLIRQVLFNLIKNAIEASPQNGSVDCHLSKTDREFTISVIDYGQGISEEDKEKVFEPFYSKKTGNKTEGMGLGLAISKEIVEAFNGTLNFKANKEKGTVFEVTLPLQTES
ncbi:MAG: PAS domain-containing sensor histidine kinase [Calditrichaeota bacterium]|nr:MAG: PAS domain-containing sensor histidine kinase [Calditrichota bacterium]MBL1204688.1 PAS domain-containing sensor histidine kinase [Calditrichota bacterium]NOG44516.1 PAS domain-containing sensor histidine kinase [Calditrichota bacterium]